MSNQRARIRLVEFCLIAVLAFSGAAHAEHVSNPTASYVKMKQRHAELVHTKDPRTAQAIATLSFCSKLPEIAPPTGRMIILRITSAVATGRSTLRRPLSRRSTTTLSGV